MDTTDSGRLRELEDSVLRLRLPLSEPTSLLLRVSLFHILTRFRSRVVSCYGCDLLVLLLVSCVGVKRWLAVKFPLEIRRASIQWGDCRFVASVIAVKYRWVSFSMDAHCIEECVDHR